MGKGTLGSARALHAPAVTVRKMAAGRVPPVTRAPILSRNGSSASTLPTQTATPRFAVYPTVQACAVSTGLARNGATPLWLALGRPLGSFPAGFWLSAQLRSLTIDGGNAVT